MQLVASGDHLAHGFCSTRGGRRRRRFHYCTISPSGTGRSSLSHWGLLKGRPPGEILPIPPSKSIVLQRRAVPDVPRHVPTFLGEDYAVQCRDMPWHVRDNALIAKRRAVSDVPRHVPTVCGEDYAVQCRDMPWHVRDNTLIARRFVRFRTCHGTSLQFAVRITLFSVGTPHVASAITPSLRGVVRFRTCTYFGVRQITKRGCARFFGTPSCYCLTTLSIL